MPQGAWLFYGLLLAATAIGGYGITHGDRGLEAVLAWVLLLLGAAVLALALSCEVALALRGKQRSRPQVGSTGRTPSRSGDRRVLRITRESKSRQDVFRRYKILVDGRQVGRVADGRTFEIPITPGPHTLQLKVDWVGSPQLHFVATGNQAVEFACASSGRVADSSAKLAASRQDPDCWIELRKLSD